MSKSLSKLFLIFFILGLSSLMPSDSNSNYIQKEKLEFIAAERLYLSLVSYADTFNVPKYFAFNIATLETNYRGPLDSLYRPNLISKSGAMGPMQILWKYSHHYAGRRVSKKELKDNIDFNVKISMKIISSHFEKYKSWAKTAGAYNTGRPVINSYALKAIDTTYYRKRWIKIKG